MTQIDNTRLYFAHGFYGEENKHIFSCNSWLLHEAGKVCRENKIHMPYKIKKSSGYGVKIEREGVAHLIKWDKDLKNATITRIEKY